MLCPRGWNENMIYAVMQRQQHSLIFLKTASGHLTRLAQTYTATIQRFVSHW